MFNFDLNLPLYDYIESSGIIALLEDVLSFLVVEVVHVVGDEV